MGWRARKGEARLAPTIVVNDAGRLRARRGPLRRRRRRGAPKRRFTAWRVGGTLAPVSKTKRVVLVLVLLALLPLGFVAPRYVRGAQFLTRLAPPTTSQDTNVGAGRAPPLLDEVDVQIAASPRPIRARLYRLAGSGPRQGIVVAHGVHYRGIDEARLVPFARALAREGVVVLTPELFELTQYRVSPGDVAVIEAAVTYLAGRHDVVSDDRVGLLGFSFAGGLSLIAASHPETQQHLNQVTSVGGHYDLMNVMQFLVTGQLDTPQGTRTAKPHEYGLLILIHQNVDSFVPEADRDTLRTAFVAWLHEDRDTARSAAQSLITPEGRRLFSLLENQRLAELSGKLLKILDAQRPELAALSPKGRLNALQIPANLLHGAGDAVIPPSETDWAERELSEAGVPHLSLVTPLIEHVEVEGEPNLIDKFRLVRFMAQLF